MNVDKVPDLDLPLPLRTPPAADGVSPIDPPIKVKKGFFGWFNNHKKKNRVLIHLFNKNGTSTPYIKAPKGRRFSIKGDEYIRGDASQGRYNTLYKMFEFQYIEGCPEPISFDGVKIDEIKIDGKALKSVIKMEYVELLTKVAKVKDLIIFAAVFSGIGAGIGLINMLLIAKGFNFF